MGASERQMQLVTLGIGPSSESQAHLDSLASEETIHRLSEK